MSGPTGAVADSLDEAKAAFRAAGERAVGVNPRDGLAAKVATATQESSEHGRMGIELSEKIGELLHVHPDVSHWKLQPPFSCAGAS